VLEIFVTKVFDTKVVDTQIKPDGMGDMFPKTRCELYLKVAMSSQGLA
jgi:hypothetical protein